MTEAAPGLRLAWRVATLVEKVPETPTTVTLSFDVPDWPRHRSGQHVDVRLTAADGYQAQRSYSIASAPEDGGLALTVERLADGEVSPYLVDELMPGDPLELRGPVGGWFAWELSDGGPLWLVAGGSGLVPLMSMLRHRRASASQIPARLLVSARRSEELLYRAELDRLAGEDDAPQLFVTLTRARPEGWTGYARRVDAAMLEEAGFPPAARPLVFVCGPTRFVENAAEALVALGHDPARVKTERFGPTGAPS